jgi:hypothetical protein
MKGWHDDEYEFHFNKISENWMYEWLDDLKDFEKIEFSRHVKQRIYSPSSYQGKGKAFILKKIKEHIQPKTVMLILFLESDISNLVWRLA